MTDVKVENIPESEVWKDIDYITEPDGTCAYQVSNLGNVRRAKEVVSKVDVKGLGVAGWIGQYSRHLKPKSLKINRTRSRKGEQRYCYVSIKDIKYPVHRLVAKAFLPETYKDGMTVNHKDGNRFNNNVVNLEWCTQSENELHSYRVLGKQVWNKGTKGLMPKEWTKERKAIYIQRNKDVMKDKAEGMTARQLSEKYNVCTRQIYGILKQGEIYEQQE
ncbi:MAG: HNH endonuclease [Thermoguttaceae bacterium]|nr:HNH endonuclease [Thermoguttaceae bacterium]